MIGHITFYYCNMERNDFLVTGDVVDTEDYTADGLHEANHDMQKFYAALHIAEELW